MIPAKVMTPPNERTDHVEQTRWRDWEKSYARSSRRSGIHARIVALVISAGIAVNLALQLLAASRVV
jgi:hypothetical protein